MTILRYDILVDDQEHKLVCGRIVHVDCRDIRNVTIWADDRAPRIHIFRVFGTGHEIVGPWEHVGTALSPSGSSPYGTLVWHLFELDPDEPF